MELSDYERGRREGLREACAVVEGLPGFRLKEGGGLVMNRDEGSWLNRHRVIAALKGDSV